MFVAKARVCPGRISVSPLASYLPTGLTYSFRALTMESTHHKAKEERFAAGHTIPGTLSPLLELSILEHSGKDSALGKGSYFGTNAFVNISKGMFKNNLGISLQSPPPDSPRQPLSSHLPSPALSLVY